ncbi:MAG: DinB family protein [Gemmatimonadota bacterium]
MALEQLLREQILSTWRTNHRTTAFLLENLPAELWPTKVPGAPRRTVRMIAGHLHNCRCMWIKMLGPRHGLIPPPGVDRHRVEPAELLPALERSSEGIVELLRIGLDNGGRLTGFSPDVVHFLAYHVAHEGHHRGQICMVARQTGLRLPSRVTAGLWQWSKRAKEGASR